MDGDRDRASSLAARSATRSTGSPWLRGRLHRLAHRGEVPLETSSTSADSAVVVGVAILFITSKKEDRIAPASVRNPLIFIENVSTAEYLSSPMSALLALVAFMVVAPASSARCWSVRWCCA